MSGTNHLLSWLQSDAQMWDRCLRATVDFANGAHPPELNKHIGLLFMNSSLRTRASMEVAAGRLGCRLTALTGQDTWSLAWQEGAVMDGADVEHARDAARVLSGYFDLIGLRSFSPLPNATDELLDTPVGRLAGYSEAPIVNLESASFHPCQALADAAVLMQRFNGNPSGKEFVLSWAYHPRALPLAVPQSTLLMAARLGTNVTVAAPPGFSLSDRIVDEARSIASRTGGTVKTTSDLAEAASGGNVIYAKSWTPAAISQTDDSGAAIRSQFRDWRISTELMRSTDSGVFMHCLPIRRNVIADDAVIDSTNSAILQQARMRVDANLAIITALLDTD